MCLYGGILHSTHCSCLGHGLLNRNLDKLRSTQQVQISKMGQKVCRLTQFQLANICMTLAKSERGWEEKHFDDLLIATTLFPKKKRHKQASTILDMFFDQHHSWVVAIVGREESTSGWSVCPAPAAAAHLFYLPLALLGAPVTLKRFSYFTFRFSFFSLTLLHPL